eukprot:jgi/Botrbrau1/21483/Bobra.0458s0001.1
MSLSRGLNSFLRGLYKMCHPALCVPAVEYRGAPKRNSSGVLSAPSHCPSISAIGFAALPLLENSLRKSRRVDIRLTPPSHRVIAAVSFRDITQNGAIIRNMEALAVWETESKEKQHYRDFWPVVGWDLLETSSASRLNLVLLEDGHRRLLPHDVCTFSKFQLERMQEVHLASKLWVSVTVLARYFLVPSSLGDQNICVLDKHG